MPIEIEQYIDNVFRFALSLTSDRHLAEDLTQDCLLRAFAAQSQLKSRDSTKSWLFQILINLWKDQLKKKTITISGDRCIDLAGVEEQPDSTCIQHEERERIFRLMQGLPDQQRTVLFLSAVEQLTHQEIVSLLNLSMSSVKANLSIARKTLRKQLLPMARKEQL